MKPGDAQLAHTDALLTSVGAREAGSIGGDAFATALLDFAYDVDLTVGIADLDTQPIPVEQLRLTAAPVRPRRVTWRVLVPATGTALAAIVVAATVLIGRANPVVVSPSATATAESHQLLEHANTLIADATKAAPAVRKRLVSEARADLVHVTHLLPLAPPEQRPALRKQLNSLEQRVVPPPPHAANTSGNNGGNGSSGTSGSSSGTPIRSGSGDGTGTVVPSPAPTEGGQQPSPPPIHSGPGGSDSGTGSGEGGTSGASSGPPTRPQPPQAGGSGSGRQGPPPGSGGSSAEGSQTTS
jgi:hypothetical protein